MKKEAKIKPFWYSDIWLFPKLITIITTLDEQGRINAAPYSHIMQYDVMSKNPRMIVGFRQDSHTFRNICATGEFVVELPFGRTPRRHDDHGALLPGRRQ